ncbi:flagellar biosynthesis protein FlhA [bacterium]|nr:flagellar biosynthesis protein FlhA [bacterium]MBU1071991.1 flagellar biosynthesis protein FlhA [bacterium]MBU1674544.1 flagellar biosynthesis protein FlhA [bacterium]
MSGLEDARGIDRDLILANSNVLSALAVVSVIGLMIMPVKPLVLDLLITFNIAFAVVILLVSLYLKEPLHFSSFPSLLLIVTLYRLALNVASTRLILSKAAAGKVIASFGDFVIGGNYVIGVIVFAILVIVQFVVITKGSGRIAEVAARFTLDAMPGKQMAIDADLNAGLINEVQARERRAKVASEAEFFGAMDGASKFVRGDAIAGIIITLINIIGGFVIGMLQMGMSAGESMRQFMVLTVGDGLVTQIPALLISTAAGMVVTRSSGSLNLGQALTMQIFKQPKAVYLASGTLAVFGLIPGLPTLPFLGLAAAFAVVGRFVSGRVRNVEKQQEESLAVEEADQAAGAQESRSIRELYVTDALELELGYGLLPLVDESRGGDLLVRITNIRKQISAELGMIIQPVRVRDNLQLGASEYVLKLKGVEISRAELRPDRLLAMSTGGEGGEKLEGIATVEPAFKLPAIWIDKGRKAAAEMEGYTVVEPTAVLATHLSETIRNHADELMSRQDVKDMCETVREFAPALIEDLIPDKVPVNTLHNVLRGLLHERIPVKDIVTILETLANYVGGNTGTDLLLEKVRESLRRTISGLYVEPDGNVYAVTLHPEIEYQLGQAAQESDKVGAVVLDPLLAQVFLERLERTLQVVYSRGKPPVLLVPTPMRLFVKRLIEPTFPSLPVMGYTEVNANTNVQSAGIVSTQGVRDAQQATA